MANFGFNDIKATDKADITKVMENFTKINNLGITSQETDSKISTMKQSITTETDNKLNNYTKTANLKPLAKVNYSYGTSNPSGGSNGDIYDQYFN